MPRSCLTIILGAGEGTRMRSSRPKVLHAIGGKVLIRHVADAVAPLAGRVAVVVGPGAEAIGRQVPGAEVFVQHERRGTAHAVLAARAAIERKTDDIVVVFADTPLLLPATLQRLRQAIAD